MKLTEDGHKQIASDMRPNTFWLAWGTSDSNLTNVIENPEDTALETEVGRTIQTANKFVEPDEVGTIAVGGQNWSVTAGDGEEVSKYVYLKFTFSSTDNDDDGNISQLGLYIDFSPTTAEDTFVDTTVVTGDKDGGTLVEHMNLSTEIVRDGSTSENYDMIFTY